MNWTDASKRHTKLKQEIEMMIVDKNYLVITKAPEWIVKQAEKRIAKLQKKLKKYAV